MKKIIENWHLIAIAINVILWSGYGGYIICENKYNPGAKYTVPITIVMDSIEYGLQFESNVTAGEIYVKLKTK